MTHTAFRQHLADHRITQRGFARLHGYNERTVRRWACGALPIPDEVAERIDPPSDRLWWMGR